MFRYHIYVRGSSFKLATIDLTVPAQVDDIIHSSGYSYRVFQISHEIEMIDGRGMQSDSNRSQSNIYVEKID